MSLTLVAFHEDKKDLHIRTGLWSGALDRGVGLVIGYGLSSTPGKFRYQIQKVHPPIEDSMDEEEIQELKEHWKSDPMNGGGYFITSQQSKMMALALWGLISVEAGKRQDWSLTPDYLREYVESSKSSCSPPMPEHVIEGWEELAGWMATSGGFRIW